MVPEELSLQLLDHKSHLQQCQNTCFPMLMNPFYTDKAKQDLPFRGYHVTASAVCA